MENFSFYMPTRLFFGAGSVKRLAKARLPQGTGLIITSGTSTTKLGYVAKVADTLAEAGHPTMVYNKVQPNPTIEGVRECAALCREQNIAFVVRRKRQPEVCRTAWCLRACFMTPANVICRMSRHLLRSSSRSTRSAKNVCFA